MFYNAGVRYITLVHSSNNDLADSATDPNGPEHQGLSPFGEEVVREMNRLELWLMSHTAATMSFTMPLLFQSSYYRKSF